MPSLLIFSSLFYEIQDIVDRLFGIVSGDGVLNVSEEFGVVFNGLTVSVRLVVRVRSTYFIVFSKLEL